MAIFRPLLNLIRTVLDNIGLVRARAAPVRTLGREWLRRIMRARDSGIVVGLRRILRAGEHWPTERELGPALRAAGISIDNVRLRELRRMARRLEEQQIAIRARDPNRTIFLNRIPVVAGDPDRPRIRAIFEIQEEDTLGNLMAPRHITMYFDNRASANTFLAQAREQLEAGQLSNNYPMIISSISLVELYRRY